MDENLTELQRKVLALLTTVRGGSTRRRLCEIHERLGARRDTSRDQVPAPREARQRPSSR